MKLPLAQRRPVNAANEMTREIGLEESTGVVGIRKGGLDELVVGLVKRTLGHECDHRCGAEREGSLKFLSNPRAWRAWSGSNKGCPIARRRASHKGEKKVDFARE
jgi:hypothetical protein